MHGISLSIHGMGKARIAALCFAAVLISVTLTADATAAQAKVSGAIVDDNGKVVAEATITLTTPSKRTFGPFSVLDGQIGTAIDLGSETQAMVLITSPGKKPRRLTVELRDQVLDVGKIQLQPDATIELRNLVYLPSTSTSNSGYIDVFAKNGSKEDLIISEMKVSARRRRKTDCGDVPGLHDYVFELRNDLQLSTGTPGDLVLDVSTPHASDKGVIAAKGQVDFLPCSQIQLDFTILYPFTIRASSEEKLRVTLPMLPSERASILTAVDLRPWEMLSFEIVTPGGNRSLAIDP